MNEGRGAVLGPLHALFSAGSFAGWTDEQLLERFCERRDEIGERAFAALVERHGAGVLRVCRGVLGDPHDADDAFQATFLVLARRAHSIRDRRAVGHWLLGVAYRVAGCARAAAVRRREHERRAAEFATPLVAGEEPSDWRPVLREELGRLPGKFQVPLVLCYLEGLTQEEVARRLGWPIGTVRSRLARGRERLRHRLVLRGVAPTAAAMAVGMWRQAEAVALPEALVATTARAAVSQAATAGAVSTAVATLTEEVLRTMISTRLTMNAAAVLMAGLIATGAGVVAGQAGGRPGQGPDVGANAPATVPKAEHLKVPPHDDRLYVEAEVKAREADLARTQAKLEQAEVVVEEAEADLKGARAEVRVAEAALSAAHARLDALRSGSGPPAPKQAPRAAKEGASAASDQERRLRAVEEKLDRLLSERGPTRDAIQGNPPRPEGGSPAEERGHRKAAVWDRLQRDGFIGRFDAEPVRPEFFYIMVYSRYLGRRPSSKELDPLLAYYSPDPDQKVVEPENAVRRMLTREEFWSSPLAAVLLRESAPRDDRPR